MTYYGIKEENNKKDFYIVTEFCSEGDLKSLLRRERTIDMKVKIQLARNICAGMIGVQQRGIVHRDLAGKGQSE